MIVFLLQMVYLLNSVAKGSEVMDYYPLLSKVTGSVAAENFTYYQIYYRGNILLRLTSIKGDADLYVSQHNEPTFEPHTYDVHSATCGLDSVQVFSHWWRPFNVGIYGHISHDVSEYVLEVFQLPSMSKTEEQLFDWDYSENVDAPNNKKNDKENPPNKPTAANNNNNGERKNKRRISSSGNNKVGIWALLEILEMLFL